MKNAVSVRGLSHRFGNLPVLDNISLDVGKGETVSLLGPSGCGKSTLLHILAGLTERISGTIRLEEREITGHPGFIGYMQQEDLLLPWKTVLDNVALPLRVRGWSRKESRNRAARLFPEFGLDGFEKYYPAWLSGGMRQRAALMRTCLPEPRLMLLDEPFTRLDTGSRRSLHAWFLRAAERLEFSTLFVTHDVDEALTVSDRICVLSARPARLSREWRVPRDREERIELKETILTLVNSFYMEE